MSLKSWWRNENYDREHMRRFREERPEFDDLPDDLAAQLAVFQWYAVGEAVRALWESIRRPK